MSAPAGVTVSVCETCGSGFFPGPLICPRCGSARWHERQVESGTVEQVTVVRRAAGGLADPAVLATVHLESGQRVVVRLRDDAAPGSHVELGQAGGALYASVKRP